MPGHRITSLLLVCTLGLSLPVRAQIAPGVSLACMAPAIAAAPAPSGVALARIAGDGRKLLALRGYLRARGLAERWSWSDAQIAAYAGSPERWHAQAAVARVQAVFADANPGFALHVNLQVRSLDEQLRKWNENGILALIFAHLFSLELMRVIFAKQVAQGKGPGAIPPASAN